MSMYMYRRLYGNATPVESRAPAGSKESVKLDSLKQELGIVQRRVRLRMKGLGLHTFVHKLESRQGSSACKRSTS